MTRFTLGSVPYANAIPLVSLFEQQDLGVRVVYDVPSRLPLLLEFGEADAILVSSVDALRVPGRRMAEGVCIGSRGPVKSVRLFSRVHPSLIRSLALDESSMTSNRLAQIILKERFGISPPTRFKSPDLAEMLKECDACVLIGDIGMTAPSLGLHVLDLGDEWTRLTGKGFVWAAWIGNDGVTPELVTLLNRAASYYEAGKGRRALFAWGAEERPRKEELIAIGKAKLGWDERAMRDYFFEVMVYEMSPSMLEGLRVFQSKLLEHGFADCVHFPEMVRSA